jgi:hypothetical protein
MGWYAGVYIAIIMECYGDVDIAYNGLVSNHLYSHYTHCNGVVWRRL